MFKSPPPLSKDSSISVPILADQFERQLTTSTDLSKARYHTDVPLATPLERITAGFPRASLIWPNPGDLLEQMAFRVPAIHSPFGYELGNVFGALFSCHVEDADLFFIKSLILWTKSLGCDFGRTTTTSQPYQRLWPTYKISDYFHSKTHA